MFREMDGIKLENVQLPNALETFWHCRNIELKNVQIDKADYLFIHSENIKIQNYAQNGNYSFQYCKNVEILQFTRRKFLECQPRYSPFSSES